MNYNILVCDDDEAIVKAIGIYLELEGYKVFKAYNGLEALEVLKKEDVHLLIMDIMMPKMDGVEATMEIRKTKHIPIILVTAKSEDTDKITGLNFGADDYVTKPFNALELMARVKSQLRRYTAYGSMEKQENQIQTGGLALNRDLKEVSLDGELVPVTPTEFKILEFLMGNMGKVFSITEIYENVWQEQAISVENTVAVHIRRLREKIEIDSKNPRYLKVVWGVGYKIEKITL